MAHSWVLLFLQQGNGCKVHAGYYPCVIGPSGLPWREKAAYAVVYPAWSVTVTTVGSNAHTYKHAGRHL